LHNKKLAQEFCKFFVQEKNLQNCFFLVQVFYNPVILFYFILVQIDWKIFVQVL